MEKLCIFCSHFIWTSEKMWKIGSDQTGPMFEGGDATCNKGHYKDNPFPKDQDEYREIILRANKCRDYDQIEPNWKKQAKMERQT